MQVAEEATEMMGNMKGAFMKLGQILSFATEVVPENARNALARLQMDAPPMGFPIVRARGRAATWARISARCSRRFDEEPIAAASIGQVHRARSCATAKRSWSRCSTRASAPRSRATSRRAAASR